MAIATAVQFGQKQKSSPALEWSSQQRRVLQPGARLGAGSQEGDHACYLIERGVAANYIPVEENRLACVGLAGPGSMIGLDSVFGDWTPTCTQARAVVELQLVQLPVADLRGAMQETPALQQACLRYLQACLLETQHIAACNARHLLPARCAHWLLRLQDQLGDVLPVTHEFLAAVLGVRRAGVTVTLQALQRAGAIRQQRGRIVIVAEDILRHSACSCPIGLKPDGQALLALPITARDQIIAAPIDRKPRARINAAIQDQLHARPHSGEAIARIGAVLQVCRTVMEQTQEVLAG